MQIFFRGLLGARKSSSDFGSYLTYLYKLSDAPWIVHVMNEVTLVIFVGIVLILGSLVSRANNRLLKL